MDAPEIEHWPTACNSTSHRHLKRYLLKSGDSQAHNLDFHCVPRSSMDPSKRSSSFCFSCAPLYPVRTLLVFRWALPGLVGVSLTQSSVLLRTATFASELPCLERPAPRYLRASSGSTLQTCGSAKRYSPMVTEQSPGEKRRLLAKNLHVLQDISYGLHRSSGATAIQWPFVPHQLRRLAGCRIFVDLLAGPEPTEFF